MFMSFAQFKALQSNRSPENNCATRLVWSDIRHRSCKHCLQKLEMLESYQRMKNIGYFSHQSSDCNQYSKSSPFKPLRSFHWPMSSLHNLLQLFHCLTIQASSPVGQVFKLQFMADSTGILTYTTNHIKCCQRVCSLSDALNRMQEVHISICFQLCVVMTCFHYTWIN